MPSIAPTSPDDLDIYLVLDDFGSRLGRAWREIDEERTDRRTLLTDLIDGQYSDPARVVVFNTAEGAESLKAIGRAFGKESSSIYFLVAPHGGIRPAERRRSRLALTLAEREVISRGVTIHQSARSIAKLLGRSPSTVSREMSHWLANVPAPGRARLSRPGV
jgi:DNA-binding CsgD family transcriptional regulator